MTPELAQGQEATSGTAEAVKCPVMASLAGCCDLTNNAGEETAIYPCD